MSRFRTLATALVAVAAMTMCAMPAFANPGNGNGNSGNSQKGNSGSKNNQQSEQRKNYGKPDHVDSDISFNVARQYAVRYGLVIPPFLTEVISRIRSCVEYAASA